ncbi:uncharacterized protein MYCFIDRAFT_173731 [Pseudocercospora fijiensis CIRAD86]|uniref:Uncharacterized protein n=1 Tax=Pseudocercospora fijiensis (strain CIRAD86) TaxID=383855 RepID=M2Z4T8_PSEFD|nr:uncharacterized protein MYCFIDRAFT_173731 [Pseudocercospora fijiensis CIRAD86]EME84810.1 hypothetical protein MYCFIDRAFT_173731 [Pseudocercospora fijiensis CIRAD86]
MRGMQEPLQINIEAQQLVPKLERSYLIRLSNIAVSTYAGASIINAKTLVALRRAKSPSFARVQPFDLVPVKHRGRSSRFRQLISRSMSHNSDELSLALLTQNSSTTTNKPSLHHCHDPGACVGADMMDHSSALIFHVAFGIQKRYSRPNKACTLPTRTDSCRTVELPAGVLRPWIQALIGEQGEKGKSSDWASASHSHNLFRLTLQIQTISWDDKLPLDTLVVRKISIRHSDMHIQAQYGRQCNRSHQTWRVNTRYWNCRSWNASYDAPNKSVCILRIHLDHTNGLRIAKHDVLMITRSVSAHARLLEFDELDTKIAGVVFDNLGQTSRIRLRQVVLILDGYKTSQSPELCWSAIALTTLQSSGQPEHNAKSGLEDSALASRKTKYQNFVVLLSMQRPKRWTWKAPTHFATLAKNSITLISTTAEQYWQSPMTFMLSKLILSFCADRVRLNSNPHLPYATLTSCSNFTYLILAPSSNDMTTFTNQGTSTKSQSLPDTRVSAGTWRQTMLSSAARHKWWRGVA